MSAAIGDHHYIVACNPNFYHHLPCSPLSSHSRLGARWMSTVLTRSTLLGNCTYLSERLVHSLVLQSFIVEQSTHTPRLAVPVNHQPLFDS